MTSTVSTRPTEIVPPEGSTAWTIRDQFHVAAAYRFAGTIQLSGQTGHRPDLSQPESVEDEIDQAFANVTAVLEAAGSSWTDVLVLRTYHVVPAGADSIPGDAMGAVMARTAALMPGHYPVWTAVTVPVLAFPGQRFEIEVLAGA